MRKSIVYFGLVLSIFIVGCEEEITPEVVGTEPDIVVEGYIESGEGALPTYVLLTKSFPFYSRLDFDKLGELIVRDAIVSVTDEQGNEFPLTELCLKDLPIDIQEQVAVILGISLTNGGQVENICAYVDLAGAIQPIVGGTYELNILAEGKELHASTTIPVHIPIDSLWFTEPPGEPNDTLAEMNCRVNDPAGADYYRYLTAVNGGPLIASFGSVTDDAFFDGQEFSFPLNKAEDPNADDLDFNTFGLWERGDSARLKWLNIDKDHFDFWLTFEFNRNNQGPFSAATKVNFNINGGIGIWGGQSVSYYDVLVPLK